MIGRFSSADLKVLSPLAALTLRLSIASRNMRPSSMQIHRFIWFFTVSQHFQGGSLDPQFQRKRGVICNQNERFVYTRAHFSGKRCQLSRDEGLGPPNELVRKTWRDFLALAAVSEHFSWNLRDEGLGPFPVNLSCRTCHPLNNPPWS